MKVSWTQLKSFLYDRALNAQYVEFENKYWIKGIDTTFEVECILEKNPTDKTDLDEFEANYKDLGNTLIGEQRDSDGSVLARAKITKSGWHYHMHAIEFEIGVINSIHDKKIDYTDYNWATIKFYDAAMVEQTTQVNITLNAVWTLVDFEPRIDYDVAGGMIRQKVIPATDIYTWVQAVPDIPEAYGGSKIFVSNVNLAYLPANGGIDANGRAPKTLYYDATYHTSKLRIKMRHGIGVTHKINFLFEMFKA